MNITIQMGRLTRDPEVRYTGNGNQTAVARLTIAVSNPFKKDENGQAVTEFFDWTAFGKQAEIAERYLTKGSKVLLQGREQPENYTNKDGQRVYHTSHIVTVIEFAESKRSSDTPAMAAPNAQMPDVDYNDRDLPFN